MAVSIGINEYVPDPHVVRLVEVFGASDGGINLVNFKSNYEDLVVMAADGDEQAIYFVGLMAETIAFINAFCER